MSWKGLLKFILLTAWIAFVSLFSYNSYKPDIWAKHKSVDNCLYEITKHPIKFQPNLYVATVYAETNAFGDVMFLTDYGSKKSKLDIICSVRLKTGEIVWLNMDGKDYVNKR